MLLDGKGALLEVAREVTQLMRNEGVHAPVVGGVAVVLHGYVRTTSDVHLFTDDLPHVAKILKGGGFRFQKARREFIRDQIPIHPVTEQESGFHPKNLLRSEEIETVSLADLMNMKLQSGLANPLRAIDLADVIGLIRVRRLTTSFATHLSKELRKDYRKLASAVWREKRK